MRRSSLPRLFPLAALLSTVAFAVGPAAAQPNASDQAVAAALFEDGQKLLDAKKFDEACPKLAESQRLEPLLGTLLNLAYCHEKQEHTASAWVEFSSAAEQASRAKDKRAKFARDHADALSKRLSRLTVSAAPSPGSVNAAGTRVTIDGKELSAAAIGTPIPLDPGEHTVEASAPGKTTWSKKLTLAAGPASQTLEIPRLADAPAAVTPVPSGTTPVPVALPPATGSAAQPPPPPPPPPEAPSGRNNGMLGGGIALGAAGVAGVVVGSVFGLRTFQRKSDAAPHCTAKGVCDDIGFAAQQDAHSSATISNIAFGLGLGAVVAGTVLIVLSTPSKPRPAAWIAPSVGPGSAGLAVSGAF